MKRSHKKRLEELEQKLNKFGACSLTEEEEEEFYALTTEYVSQCHMSQLEEIMDEASDRVWYDCMKEGSPHQSKNLPQHIKEDKFIQKELERVEEEYGINVNNITDRYHGYWCGILALSRFLDGGWGGEIEDIREGIEGEGFLEF